jgi:hypothetical protein
VTGTPARRRFRSLGALGVVLALVLPTLVLRAGFESSLWMDEVHTLQLVHLPVSRLLAECARDAHPPGYFLALKVWLKAARVAGFEPGVRWARGLGVAVWAGLALSTALAGRRLWGRAGAAGLVAAVGGGAYAAEWAVELRGTGFAFAGAVVAFLALLVADEEARAGRWGRAAATVAVHATAAAAACWSHLLAAPLLVLAGLAWAGQAVAGPRSGRGRRLALGLASHGVALAAFLPWLVRVPRQVAGLAAAGTDWMTPPTWGNLARVVTYWFPLGRVADPRASPWVWLAALGVAALLVPALAAAFARRRRPGAGAAGLAALAAAAGFVVLLWGLDRAGLAPVFHGPRYPALAVGLWSVGLAALAVSASGSSPRPTARTLVLLAPWLAASAIGHGAALRQEARGGLVAARPAIAVALAGPGEPVYVLPTELAPFFRASLAPFRVEPVEDLACGLVERGRAVVLDVNPWDGLDRLRDRLASRAIARGLLALEVAPRDLPAPALGAGLVVLRGAGPAATALCQREMGPPPRLPSGAVSAALPEDQLAGDGWHGLELDDDLNPRRWSATPAVGLRFDRPLAAGRWELHLVARRLPHPRPRQAVCVVPPAGGEPACSIRPEGSFELVVPFELAAGEARPRAVVRHPLWSPARALGNRDRRRLGFLLGAAWVEPGAREEAP